MIPIHTLLLEDNRGDAAMIQRRLSQARQLKFTVDHAEWLSGALTAMKNRTYDIIFVDLTLPDSNGIDTVVAVKRAAPNTPVVVLSGREDLDTATNSVRAGAQSFIVKKPELTADELERVALYAIERTRNEHTSKELLRQSVKRLVVDERGPSSPPGAALVTEHVDRIEESFGEVRAFLQKNYPTAADAVDSILNSKNTFATIRELRSMLNLEEVASTKNSSRITARALRAVRDMSAEASTMTKSEAESTLLSLIGESDEQ